MTKTLKAYYGSDGGEGDEEIGVIVFARTAAAAQRLAGAKFDVEANEQVVRRCSWADAYSPGPVPPLVALDHGWHFECGCGVKIDSDREAWTNDGAVLILDPVVMDGDIWCSQKCYFNLQSGRAQQKAAEAVAIAALVNIALDKYPGASITKTHAYAPRKGDGYITKQCHVYFRFPGQAHGDASLRYEKAGERPTTMVCQGDTDAWTTYAATLIVKDEKSI